MLGDQRRPRTRDSKPAIRYVTASVHVDYLKPTPIDATLILKGIVKEIKGKKVVVQVTVSVNDEICARGEVIAVKIPKNMIPS